MCALAKLTWQISSNNGPGWHVILGDNGAGKSSFIRAIALSLIGPTDAPALRQDWTKWLHSETDKGQIDVELHHASQYDHFSGPVKVVIVRHRQGQDKQSKSPSLAAGRKPKSNTTPVRIMILKDSDGDVYLKAGSKSNLVYQNHIWGDKTGWFSASYGPFRRFSGGDQDYEAIINNKPKLARHLTAFGENIALTETLRWLQQLRFKQYENKPEGQLLNLVKSFINQDDFLPNGVCLDTVTSDSVGFVDGNGCHISIEELSDGYRSILSMTFELIRQLAICYGADKVFDPDDPNKVIVPGVVLIDEVDAHLHPTWQRRIGVWFRTHFPNIQFIVTTHSPLVCQAATHGTVFKLPTPGTDEQGRMINGIELNRLLYGNILDAYSTGAFGSEVGRSEEGQRKLERLAELNFRELDGLLTEEEEHEQDQLRAMFPTTSHILAPSASGAA